MDTNFKYTLVSYLELGTHNCLKKSKYLFVDHHGVFSFFVDRLLGIDCLDSDKSERYVTNERNKYVNNVSVFDNYVIK